jgi:hypothetical protein
MALGWRVACMLTPSLPCADYLDHFETCEQALQDLEPALYRLASHLGKDKSDLVVYDPFFCKGGVCELFKKIGVEVNECSSCSRRVAQASHCLPLPHLPPSSTFLHPDLLSFLSLDKSSPSPHTQKLVHAKRDFWADVAKGTVPEYDILVTNPPYSGDHKERIIKFCAESGELMLWKGGRRTISHSPLPDPWFVLAGKPWALLMPNYVANKAYWQDEVQPLSNAERGRTLLVLQEIGLLKTHPHPCSHAIHAAHLLCPR